MRARTKGISSVRGAFAPQLASCFTCSSETFLPSTLRSTDSRTMRIDTGRRATLGKVCASAGSEWNLPDLPGAGSKVLRVLKASWAMVVSVGLSVVCQYRLD